jgi:hypothetical protein
VRSHPRRIQGGVHGVLSGKCTDSTRANAQLMRLKIEKIGM